MLVPEAPVKAAGDMLGITSRSPSCRRDDAEHAEFFEQELLMTFSVKAAIAGQGFEVVSIVRLLGHLVEAWIVRRGPHSRYDRKAQMLGRVDHRPKLREFMALSTATLTEVGGDMARFQACGINGRQLRLLA